MKTSQAQSTRRLHPNGMIVLHFDRVERTLARAQSATDTPLEIHGEQLGLPNAIVIHLRRVRRYRHHLIRQRMPDLAPDDPLRNLFGLGFTVHLFN